MLKFRAFLKDHEFQKKNIFKKQFTFNKNCEEHLRTSLGTFQLS